MFFFTTLQNTLYTNATQGRGDNALPNTACSSKKGRSSPLTTQKTATLLRPASKPKWPTGIPPSHLTALSQQLACAPHSHHGVACRYCSSKALMTFSGRPCAMACSRMNCHKPDLTTGFPTSSGAPSLASTSSLRNSVPSPGEDPRIF